MVRTAKFTEEAFIEAAIELIAEGGAAAASTAAIARKVGAPTGSLYHRFESRAAVAAAAWTWVHGSFVDRLVPPLRACEPRTAALAIVAWCRERPRWARFLLLNEASAVVDGPPPEPLRRELQAQEDRLDAAFRYCTATTGGRAEAEERLARARFLIFDGPIALLRPHLLARQPLPAYLEAMVAELHAAARVAVPEPA